MVKEKGITIQDFACLARCNFAEADLVYAQDGELEAFRAAVRRATSADVEEAGVLVVSYDRSVLLQTGTGHFSPVAAYDPESDMALVMDVARFKYPPQWLPVATLFDAMRSEDPTTSMPRGWLVLRNRQEQGLIFASQRSSHTLWPLLAKWWKTFQASVHSVVQAPPEKAASPAPYAARNRSFVSDGNPLFPRSKSAPGELASRSTGHTSRTNGEGSSCCQLQATVEKLLSTFPHSLIRNLLRTYSNEHNARVLRSVEEDLVRLLGEIEHTNAFRYVADHMQTRQMNMEGSEDGRVDSRHLYTLVLLAALQVEPVVQHWEGTAGCDLAPMLMDVREGPELLRKEVRVVRETLDAVAWQFDGSADLDHALASVDGVEETPWV